MTGRYEREYVATRVVGRERWSNGYPHTVAGPRDCSVRLLRIPRYNKRSWARVLGSTLAAEVVESGATLSCTGAKSALGQCGGEARPMLQRAMYVRGDCENARSPAPVQCRRAASIVIRTCAPKILFPEATRGPWSRRVIPLTQAGHGRSYVVRATASASRAITRIVVSGLHEYTRSRARRAAERSA